jgi:hypothetical protein
MRRDYGALHQRRAIVFLPDDGLAKKSAALHASALCQAMALTFLLP